MIREFTVSALITPNVLGVETSFEGLAKFGRFSTLNSSCLQANALSDQCLPNSTLVLIPVKRYDSIGSAPEGVVGVVSALMPGHFRLGRLNQAAGGCGGRGHLWVLNRVSAFE